MAGRGGTAYADGRQSGRPRRALVEPAGDNGARHARGCGQGARHHPRRPLTRFTTLRGALVQTAPMARHIMTLTCDDRPGIVAAVSTALLSVSANIVENQQYSDEATNLFFMRTVFDAESARRAERCSTRCGRAPPSRTSTSTVRPEAERCRTVILVSKFDHCLLDLLHRWKSGDLPIDIVAVVSNHEDCRGLVEYYGLPFIVIPVTAETKADAEAELLRLVDDERRRARRAGALHADP